MNRDLAKPLRDKAKSGAKSGAVVWHRAIWGIAGGNSVKIKVMASAHLRKQGRRGAMTEFSLNTTGIDHIVLHVRDPERSRTFYVDVLGKVPVQSSKWPH